MYLWSENQKTSGEIYKFGGARSRYAQSGAQGAARSCRLALEVSASCQPLAALSGAVVRGIVRALQLPIVILRRLTFTRAREPPKRRSSPQSDGRTMSVSQRFQSVENLARLRTVRGGEGGRIWDCRDDREAKASARAWSDGVGVNGLWGSTGAWRGRVRDRPA